MFFEVLEMLREMRRVRSKYLPEELFSDPCWDVLLDLYEARLSSTQVSVTALGATSGVPMSTALRRIGELQQHGLVEREGAVLCPIARGGRREERLVRAADLACFDQDPRWGGAR